MSHNYTGQGYDAIWKGNKPSDAPLLTVYRHFDSASVDKGIVGGLPRTMWVIDYPLLERIYYALVAGFDVYGTVGHQLAVRLYMDGLRGEGESYFLGFMPTEKRQAMVQSWYHGVKPKDIRFYDAGMPGKIPFKTDVPRQEFIEYLVKNHILPETGIQFDPINYLPHGTEYPSLPDQYKTIEDYLQAFRAVSKPGTSFFTVVKDVNANVVYIRIRKNDGSDVVVTMVINRWHDSVNFMFKEKDALNSTKDKADFLLGFRGSYPNYFIDIKQDDLPEFFHILSNMETIGLEEGTRLFHKYGINRSNPDFWSYYDWFQARFEQEQPVQSGLFDLNRYFYEAR